MQRSNGLFARFALYSFLVIAVFAALVGAGVGVYVRNVIVMGTARLVAASSTAFVTQASPRIGEGELTASQSAALDRAVRERIGQGALAGMRIVATDGAIIYSSLEGETGQRAALGEQERMALAGGIAVRVLDSGDRESALMPDVAGKSVLVVSAPALGEGTSGSRAVIQLFKPFDPVQRSARLSVLLVWVAIAIGAFGAYIVQLIVIRHAEKRLLESEAEVGEVNERLQASMRDIEEQTLGTLQALTTAVDAKDSYTARHALTVTDYSRTIAVRLGMDEEELALVERVGLLHDIGKIGIPESILLKPDKLTPQEAMLVREHSAMGARIIESIPFLRDLLPLVRHHHERWDGTGYPDGLRGEDIPLICRILAVGDAFDAMTSDRPYRRAMRPQAARAEIARYSGSQFDPTVVQAFLDAFDAGEIVVSAWHERLRA